MLVATLFQRTLDRGRRLEIGLAARGYDGALAVLTPERPLSRRRLARIALTLLAVPGLALALQP
jgi:cobalt/nickel transport system permease protein